MYDLILTESGFIRKEELTYPFEERGLQFGDGVYEVIRIYEGSFYLLEEHVERLYRSAEAISIRLPFSKKETYEYLDELLKRNDVGTDAKLYLQVTRGSAPRNHEFPLDTGANLYAYVKDFPRDTALMTEGITAVTAEDIRWEWCYIKSLNLLPNVLAKQTAKEKGAWEAILHKEGLVTEGSSSNAYLVRNGKVYTHPATKRILGGCVRMKMEAFCQEKGIPFVEEAFQVEDIGYADEMFITSSTAEILPVLKVDTVSVGDGSPGEVTRTLQKMYEEDAGIRPECSMFGKDKAKDGSSK